MWEVAEREDRGRCGKRAPVELRAEPPGGVHGQAPMVGSLLFWEFGAKVARQAQLPQNRITRLVVHARLPAVHVHTSISRSGTKTLSSLLSSVEIMLTAHLRNI